MLLDRYWSPIQDFQKTFQALGTYLSIFNIFKANGSSWLFGAHFFQRFQHFGFALFQNFPKRTFWKMTRGVPWIIWSILVSPKINNFGFGSHGHVRKPWAWWVFGFSHNEIEKALVQNWSRIILWSFRAYSLRNLYHEDGSKMKKFLNKVPMIFLWFSPDFRGVHDLL